jgi:tricorn protease
MHSEITYFRELNNTKLIFMKSRFSFILVFFLLAANSFAQQKGYYRTPAIFKDMVVFTAEGDLWKYEISKGTTTRLTTHQGMEINPLISPDGNQIAFTGQYEGVTEIYLMSINGGVPKRLTYDFGSRATKPVGWTTNGKILYISNRYNNLPDPQLMQLDPATLNIEKIPLSQVSDAAYDESNMLFFSRLPNQGSSTKRYVGGYIQQIWKFDGKQEAKCLTCDFDGTSYNPMPYKDRIFFASDRDGSMNIWSMDKDGKSLKQHTFSKEWDVKSPSISGSQIVYQRGADLWVYDIESNTTKMLDITLESDFDQRKPRWIKNPASLITYTTLSPAGNYVAMISRGRIFVAPVKGERWVEVTRKSGIRYKAIEFLNEKTITYLSDESGEFEIWKTAADGSGSPQQLTKNSKLLITSISPSHDGKYIAYKDKDEFLRVIDAASGAVKFEYQDKDFGINDVSWSSNGQYLSFDHGLENQSSQINVVEIESGKSIPVTTERLDSYSSSWNGDDHWLYFLSDRNLKTKVRSPWGSRQPEPYYTEATNLFALQLYTANKFPFLQKDAWSEDTSSAAIPKPTDKNSKAAKPFVASQNINWQQAAARLFQVPGKSGNIENLSVADGWLYWINNGDYTEGSKKLFALKMDDNKKGEPVEIAAGINNYQLSANRKKLLVAKNNTFAVTDANGAKIDFDKNKIELANWNFLIDPVEDWKQMFTDAWRMMRDYFYDKNMHQVDWTGIRKLHETLVPRITDRYELDDLLAQMVAELSALHTFVYGGDKRTSPDFIQTGFLGAHLEKDQNGLKIVHIYQSDPDYPDESSPLNRPELSVKEGDVITSVNDIPLKEVKNISELLANKVAVPVKLSLLNKSGIPYTQLVYPISAQRESSLRYSEWELTRREKVDKSSDNQIGYLHLRAMGSGDMDAFEKQFYPVYTRKGLIIDVRHNNGGNIDSWVLEKLMRKAWFYWKNRTGKPYWNMPFAFRGHMVVLCDQFTASDGEAFAEGFKRLGLGKVIGMRTWGGEIWLSSDNILVDNGIASAAENGVFGPEGKWLIEGHGVDPDILVDNLPYETYNGKDAQLEFAIDYLKKLIQKEPIEDPKVPAYPDKSFKYKKQ